MSNNKLKIIFMGTPDFAVASLQKLLENDFNIVAVITAPDKPKGRGKKMKPSPVKVHALKHNLPVLQPTNLKDPNFIDELKSYNADLQIIVAFRMLPEVVWNMPPLGSFNLHASLLPQYRGAAPINWAIINGEKETGVTTFKLKHEIDTGNILFQEKEPIHYDDTAGTLYERLMWKGARLVVKTVRAIEKGDYQLKAQKSQSSTKSAPKIFREDCEINWNQPAEKIRNFIRGLSPYPAAWSSLNGKTLKIFRTEISQKNYNDTPGTFHSDGQSCIDVVVKDGAIRLVELQIEGKKRMVTSDFLRGYHWNS